MLITKANKNVIKCNIHQIDPFFMCNNFWKVGYTACIRLLTTTFIFDMTHSTCELLSRKTKLAQYCLQFSRGFDNHREDMRISFPFFLGMLKSYFVCNPLRFIRNGVSKLRFFFHAEVEKIFLKEEVFALQSAVMQKS